MQASIDAKTLQQALKPINTLVKRADKTRRRAKPVLGQALLQILSHRVSLTATDTETYLTQSLPATATIPGACLVDPVRLARVLPRAGAVALCATGDGRVVVSTARKRADVTGDDSVDDYPVVPASETISTRAISADLAAVIVGEIAPCAGEVQAHLPYVRIEGSAAVATDTHQLAAVDLPAVDQWSPINVPAHVFSLLPRAGAWQLAQGKGYATIADGGTTLTVRCDKGGSYPDWRSVLPTGESEIRAVVDPAELRRAASEYCRLVDDRRKHCRLAVSHAGAVFSSKETADRITAPEAVTCATGEFTEVYDAGYLRRVPECGAMEYHGEDRPLVLQRPGMIYMLMPCRD